MNRLKNKHKGQNAWIIGKGPSLEFLKKTDIGAGVVITINSAIKTIYDLDLNNKDVYSMQKDGGQKKKYAGHYVLCPDCEYSGAGCADCSPNMIELKPETGLLLHDCESKFCWPDHPNR